MDECDPWLAGPLLERWPDVDGVCAACKDCPRDECLYLRHSEEKLEREGG
jgi:hypothetical protein